MSNVILNKDRNREAIIELNDADLHFVSAAAADNEGWVMNGILNALCSSGYISGLRVSISGHAYTRQCR